MKRIVALFLLLPLYFATAQENFKPIDSLLNLYKDKPGLSVMVTKNGKVVYQNQAGYADMESKELITPETVFYLASVSKQFTAACIIILEQKGKLSLDDKLSKYFPDFPAYAQKITINDLLNHTSGIRDIGSLSYLKGEDDIDYTNDKVRQLLIAQELNYEPGSAWSYTNSGYWCLAQIVEKVSGKTIAEFAHKNIFGPLKMKDTRYIAQRGLKIQHRAKGYMSDNDNYIVCPVDGFSISGAGVSATAGDLQKWLTDMTDNKVLGKKFWDRMLDENGYKREGFLYSKGFFINQYGSQKQIEHGGDVDGFHTLVAYYPNADATLIILSNNDMVSVGNVRRAAINRTLGFNYKYPAPQPAKTPIVTVSESILKQYTGRYENKEEELAMSVYLKNGQLNIIQEWDGNEYPIGAIDDTSFISEDDVSFKFTGIQEGKALHMGVKQDGYDLDFVRNDNPVSDNAMSAFVGAYYSEALGSVYIFFIENGVLRYKVGNGETNLVAVDNGDKLASLRGTMTFERDEQGHIKGFTLDHERVKNIKFVKK